MSIYAPAANSRDKDKDLFYDALAITVEEKGSFMYIRDDFSARLDERHTHEKTNGDHIVERKGYLTEGKADDTRDSRSRFMEFLRAKIILR